MDTNSSIEKNNAISSIYSFFVGLLLCLIIIYLIEAIGHFFYPLPEKIGINIHNDIIILQKYVNKIPASGMVFPLISYVIGPMLGAYICFNWSRNFWLTLLIGLIVVLLNFIAFKLVRHPLWYQIISSILPIPSSLLGIGIALRKTYN